MDFNVSSLSDEDLKELEVDEPAPGAVEETTEKDKKTEPPVAPVIEVGAFEPEEDESEEDSSKGSKGKVKEENTEDSPVESKSKAKAEEVDSIDYNNYYKLLVNKGVWTEVELQNEEGEEVQLDEESFNVLAERQAEWKAQAILEEREAQFGKQYKELVEHLSRGGRVEDLANTYEQEKELDDLDTSNLDEAEAIIEAYYENLGWDKSEIKDQIDTLKDKGDENFRTFAEKRKGDLKKSLDVEREQIKAVQHERASRIKASNEKYIKDFRASIHNQDVPEREKKEIEKFYFEHKHQLQNGKASDFYVKFEEIKQDPTKWLKLVSFVKDFEKFEKTDVTEKKVKKDVFKLIRTGESLSKKVSEDPQRGKEEKRQAPTIFKKLYNSV
jgi:hypothetical protein